MKSGKYDKNMDELIGRAIGRQRPTFDFNKWQAGHQKEIQTYKAQAKKPSDSVPSSRIGRIIMESRITKFAAMAALISAIVFTVMMLGRPVSPVYALEQSVEAMKKVAWMRIVRDMKRAEDKSGKTWHSIIHKINASKNEDGSAEITYFGKGERYRYDPSTETVTILSADSADILYRLNFYSETVDTFIDSCSENEGTEITTISEVRNGQKVKVVEAKIPRGKPMGSLGTEIWRFVIDEKTRLPLALELKGYDETGRYIEVADMSFDYPDSGPMDIYQLGAPITAKIIDKRPSVEVQSVIQNYEAARKKDPSRYNAVVVYSRPDDSGVETVEEATIFYVDGNKFRTEQLTPTWEIIESQRKGVLNLAPEMGNSLESVLNWWMARKHLSVRRARMYDGMYIHRIVHNLNITEFQRNDEVNTKWRAKESKPPNLLNWYTGGAQFLEFISNDVTKEQTITLIENEYSKQNGLICLERIDDGFFGTPQGRRHKRLCYIDKDKDYICMRMEDYFIQDRQWRREYKDAERFLIKNPDPGLEYTQLQVKEITELGRTKDGSWYPKRMENQIANQRENGRLQKDISVFTFYLDTDRDIPEDTFDSDAFSKFLE